MPDKAPPPSIHVCGSRGYGCGRLFSLTEKVLIVRGPGFDIPDSFWHQDCEADAERYCNDMNAKIKRRGS